MAAPVKTHLMACLLEESSRHLLPPRQATTHRSLRLALNYSESLYKTHQYERELQTLWQKRLFIHEHKSTKEISQKISAAAWEEINTDIDSAQSGRTEQTELEMLTWESPAWMAGEMRRWRGKMNQAETPKVAAWFLVPFMWQMMTNLWNSWNVGIFGMHFVLITWQVITSKKCIKIKRFLKSMNRPEKEIQLNSCSRFLFSAPPLLTAS